MDARTRYVAERIAEQFDIKDTGLVEQFCTRHSSAEALKEFWKPTGPPSLTVYYQAHSQGSTLRRALNPHPTARAP